MIENHGNAIIKNVLFNSKRNSNALFCVCINLSGKLKAAD